MGITLKNFIKDYTLQKNGNDLTENEKSVFKSFISTLTASDKKRYVYRETTNLYQILRANSDDVIGFNYKLFMVGDKSKLFTLHNNEVEGSIDSDEKLITDFLTIFDYFSLALFYQSNSDFKKYFKDETNKDKFIHCISALNFDEKIKLKDYYLTLVHTLEHGSYKSKSYFLSTSTDPEIVKEFYCENSIIIIAWTPFNMLFKFEQTIIDEFTKKGIPFPSEEFYPKEKEVTLKYGLLPHYIIGYIKGDILEVNNYIFEDYNVDLTNVATDGLVIDQRKFAEVLKTTNLTGSFNQTIVQSEHLHQIEP